LRTSIGTAAISLNDRRLVAAERAYLGNTARACMWEHPVFAPPVNAIGRAWGGVCLSGLPIKFERPGLAIIAQGLRANPDSVSITYFPTVDDCHVFTIYHMIVMLPPVAIGMIRLIPLK